MVLEEMSFEHRKKHNHRQTWKSVRWSRKTEIKRVDKEERIDEKKEREITLGQIRLCCGCIAKIGSDKNDGVETVIRKKDTNCLTFYAKINSFKK